MKKLFALVTFLFLFFTVTFSQMQQEIEWQITIGGNDNDELTCLSVTTDGGCIGGGYTHTGISGNKTDPLVGNLDYWVVKLDASGGIQWQNDIGGYLQDELWTVSQTSDGGYICGGKSQSYSYADKTENSMGGWDYWIVKLDALGNIEWDNTIGGSTSDRLYSISQTGDGGYICGGSSQSPISGDKTENSIGNTDYWIVKLDAAGNIQWQNTIGGSDYDELYSISQVSDGGYICGGYSDSNTSGDKTENTWGGYDYWVVKLDALGNIEWQNTIGGSDDDYMYSVEQTTDGSYVCGGYSFSDISGDKTENNLGPPNTVDYWVIKLDAAGIIQWENTIGGSNWDELHSISQTTDGGCICGGYSGSNISGDKTENSLGSDDYWVIKLDAAGNIQWQNTIGGSSYDRLYSISQATDGGFFCGGLSISNISGDKTENCFGFQEDYWIIKLTENYNWINGKLFADFNSDLIQDIGEPNFVNHKVTEINTGHFAFSHQDGSYRVTVLDTGDFTVLPAAITYYNAAPATQDAYFNGFGLMDSLNDFAFQPAGVFNDLAITITPLGPFRPGFDASYMIDYINVGTTSLSGSAVFYPHPILSYVSASVAPTLISADSVVWNIATLAPFESGSIIVTVNVNVSAVIGSEITSGVKVEPVAGDADPINNYSDWRVTITGSFDPNEILVDIDTVFTYELVNLNYLEYIIYFQNTGTDTAFNVKVFNKIPATLDLVSFEFVNSSHPMEIRFNDFIDEMEFHFENILLPDSNVNEPESHGYVRYRIKPLSSLIVGDTVINNARIFFDFNAPVLTNDANTFIELLTSIESTSVWNRSLNIYPNPATETISVYSEQPFTSVQLFNLLGEKVFEQSFAAKKEAELDVSKLAAGVYFVEVESDEISGVKKLVKE